MLTDIRDALYRAISTPRGDSLLALRIPKDLARRLNVALGSPPASRAALARRAEARARLAELRNQAPTLGQSPTVAAPVVVYFEKDRNVRELARIEGLLGAREIRWSRPDVGGDEATFDFVIRA